MQAVSEGDLKTLGQKGEELAKAFLEAKGYRTLERNYRCRLGEIDLILKRKDDEILFVEVKTRRSTQSVSPREIISSQKKMHISRVAQHYFSRKKLKDVSATFSVVIVDWSFEKPKLDWIPNAFELAWGY